MDIIKILTDFLTDEKEMQKFAPVFNLLKDNNFDIKKALNNLSPNSLMPILKEMLLNSKKTPPKPDGEYVGVSPISNFADKEIIKSLNDYFGE